MIGSNTEGPDGAGRTMRRWPRVLLLSAVPLMIMGPIGALLLARGDTADGRSTLAVGVIAAAVSGASEVYRVRRWTLARQTAIHFALMGVTVLPAVLLSGWFDLSTARGWLGAVGAFLATGVALWSAFYLVSAVLERRRAAADRP